jgi:hypothetical protein
MNQSYGRGLTWDLLEFQRLVQSVSTERRGTGLRKIVTKMIALLKAEQRKIKDEIAERRLHYLGTPVEPGV